jgi:uncharacterized membrane protein YhfC
VNKIAFQYALTILAGILCDFLFMLSRRLLAKIKIKHKARSSEYARWLEYTIGMSGPGIVLVALYSLQSLVWFSIPFKTSMFIFCLAAGLLSGSGVYFLVKFLKKFKRNEILKFCFFIFGGAFFGLLIYIVVYLFTPSPRPLFHDFFIQRAGVESVSSMCVGSIILCFISRKKSF